MSRPFLPLSSGCQSTGRQSATGAAAETELRQLAAARPHKPVARTIRSMIPRTAAPVDLEQIA